MKVVLVGCGRWGNVVGLRCENVHDIELVGVVDPALLYATWRGVPVFASAKAARDATGADAVILATPPTAGRRKQIAGLIHDGYSRIRVEKPLALSLREARKIDTLAAVHAVDLYAGHQTLAAPEARLFRKLVAAEDVVSWTSVRTTRNACPGDPLWDLAIHDAAQVAACDLRIAATLVARDNAPSAVRKTTVVLADGASIVLDEQERSVEYPGGIEVFTGEIDPLGACLASWRDHGQNLQHAIGACKLLSRRAPK